MTSIFSLIVWLGCSNSSDPKPVLRDVTNTAVVEQADAAQFADDGHGITTNISEEGGSVLSRHKSLGSVPQNAIALWLEAAIKAQENDPEGWEALGELTLPLKEDANWKSQGRHTYFVKAIEENNPAFRSFIVGATPENNYAVDMSNLQIKVAYENKRDTRGRKFMIVTSGASMPRPVYVKQSTKTKLFYISEFSSMYVDVRPPVDPEAERFE